LIGISIASMIILLGVLIFAHEFGHFIMAKKSGVGVLKFSLGFGPKIFGRKIGETEYLLSAIPLGGYVKLLGESDVEGLSEEEKQRSFSRQPVIKRIMIVAAGPVFNFLLAILIFTIVYMVGIPALTSEIGAVQENSAAYEAGLKQGDVIFAIDGVKIARWNRLAETVSSSEGRTLKISYHRDGVQQELAVTPKLLKSKNIFGEEVDAYKLGISPAPKTVIERLNPLEAGWASLQQTWLISRLTLLSLVKIIEGVLSPKTLGGPILIAQMAGTQAREGLIPFVLFMALLSINLAILNLLPIPVLDGGHLLFYLIEIVKGSEVNLKWREMANQVGFVLLIILMIFVFMLDIDRLNIKAIDEFTKFFTGK
jgi:regulator of sigma E protease